MTPQQITTARERAGLSRKELAAKLGVSWRTVEKWEQGRGGPSKTALALLKIVLKNEKSPSVGATEKENDT